jgi:tripartite-type tricarboxylate transporter receptor subunit TctC
MKERLVKISSINAVRSNRRLMLQRGAGLMAVSTASALSTSAMANMATPSSKAVRLVTPYPPGGATDILARIVQARLTESLEQPVVVEARSGAGGLLGTEIVAKSYPDGLTLLMGASGPLSINVSLYGGKLPYQPLRDLTPLSLVAAVPLVLVSAPDQAISGVANLIEQLRAKPGRYVYASAGNGTPQHLAGEMFKQATKTSMVHIPYRGTGPAVADVMAGHVNVTFENLGVVLPQLRAGRLKAIAVTSRERHASLPDVPSLHELGGALDGFDALAWYGLLAPGYLPPNISAKLQSAVQYALQQTDVKQKLTQFGSKLVANTPQQFSQFIQTEIDKWGKAVKASGATID